MAKARPNWTAGAQVGPQAVSSGVHHGLQPGTTYHYRLVATNSLGTTYGQDRLLTTFDRPEIEARLVNPRHGHRRRTARPDQPARQPIPNITSNTGPPSNYGTSVPSPAEDIGSADGTQEVSVALSNLKSGATYHFRVVAENVYGRTVSEDQEFGFYPPNCPNATVRQETASNYLPDCRAYELVSPADAGGTSLYSGGAELSEATNPARLAFGGWLDSIPGTGEPVNVLGRPLRLDPDRQGWVTKYVGIPGTETNDTNGPPGPEIHGRFLTSPAGVRTNLSMSTFLDWD